MNLFFIQIVIAFMLFWLLFFLLFQVQHKQKSDSMFEDPESQAWIRVKEPTILSSFCFNTFFICTLLESFKHE